METLIQDNLKGEIEAIGLEIVSGSKLKRSRHLPEKLSRVKRNLAIDYGESGLHLPDVDIVVYQPDTCNVLAVMSIAVVSREQIASTSDYKSKFLTDEVTRHIKVYLVSPDEDNTATHNCPPKKS